MDINHDDENDGIVGDMAQLGLDSPSSEAAEAQSPQQDKDEPIKKNHFGCQRILCDMGYGLPKEGRPRKEKILAIAKQLVNFLWWQHHQVSSSSHPTTTTTMMIPLTIVDCPDVETQNALLNRMQHVWTQQQQKQSSSSSSTTMPFPSNIEFSDQALDVYVGSNLDEMPTINGNTTISTDTSTTPTTASERSNNQSDIVYLSPDANRTLDPAQPPPHTVVVGLLIDRRVQLNRSLERSQKLSMTAAQLPLTQAGIVISRDDDGDKDQSSPADCNVAFFQSSEPLNVDCVLEAIQQWNWNCSSRSNNNEHYEDKKKKDDCFDALLQALQHHSKRHPARTRHESGPK